MTIMKHPLDAHSPLLPDHQSQHLSLNPDSLLQSPEQSVEHTKKLFESTRRSSTMMGYTMG
jgi:hypothetical protein